MKSFAVATLALLLSYAVSLSAPPLALGTEPRPRELRPIAVESLPLEVPEAADPLIATPSGPYRGAPPVTRLQILDIAQSALGQRYLHGGESWTTARAGGGVDCSGLIAKAWQVPRALESWEELATRPTTETLNVTTPQWQKLPIGERQPGDALVRYETLVRHALIYERDDADFAQNGRIWVYEAAEPRVKHTSYRLPELTRYSLVRRQGIDDVGLVGRSHDWIFGDMIDAFHRAGGEAALGTPHDDGQGLLVHAWSGDGESGVAQDFRGGSLGAAQLVRSQRRPGAFVISGARLDAYRKTVSQKPPREYDI